MNFHEILNHYMKIINCTTKELANLSGISNTTISRYRNGTRTPKYESEQLESLIEALIKLAHEKNIPNITETQLRIDLEEPLNKNEVDFEIFRNNFNTLIAILNINVADLSKYIGYDSSFISKIRSGTRKPLNIHDFTNTICKYIIEKYDNNERTKIEELIKSENTDIGQKENIQERLYFWLTNHQYIEEEYHIDIFLKKLDEFDLNDYIKAIKFDKLKVPTMPSGLPKSKLYYGLDGFKKSQLDVIKSIALSKSKENVFFYSNMSMVEASEDLEFTKKFIFGLACMLKKGLTLNIIHDLDRPFKELMLGLEGWIPLYMTGQINPYYFKDNSNKIFSQIECVGGSAALSGTCITGNIYQSKFLVTNKKEEVDFYQKNAKILLKRATSLMDIYTKDHLEEFHHLLEKNSTISSERRNILSSLPNYTLSDNLLNKILDKNQITEKDKTYIIHEIKKEIALMNKTLMHSKILDEIIVLSEEEFKDNPYHLDLSKIFYKKKSIQYTYEDYLQHIELIKKFKIKHENYDYRINNSRTFKNINIHIINNKQVIISKIKYPTIHLVIHHPTLINAIQKFQVPILEDNWN